MKKMRKILALALAGALTLSLSGCYKNYVLDGDGMVNSEPVSVPAASETTSDEGWEKPVATSEPEVETKVELPYVQVGDAVMYNDLVLFREVSDNAISGDALFGKFGFNSICFTAGNLSTFDPKNPSAEPKFVCEDSGFGNMYLVGDDLLYSQFCSEYKEDEKNTNSVYKRNLSTGESTKLVDGTIAGFSPDGKYYAVEDYAVTPYLQHYWIYSVDGDKEVAHYVYDGTTFFLGMDNVSAYILKEVEGKNEDNTPVYQVIQFDFDGSEYCLCECDFHSVSEYFYPAYDNVFTSTDDGISFQVDFYEGTGHFYSGSIKVDVSNARKYDESDTPLFDAEMNFFTEENDPEDVLPPAIAELAANQYPDYESGSGFAKVLQYYTSLPVGTFYTMAECVRYPLGDIGWRENYQFSNMNYYFLPTDAAEPVLLYRMYGKLGEKGTLEEYDYFEMQPNLMVICGFLIDKKGDYVGVYYDPVNIEGPESPIEESKTYYVAKFADDFYYEHPQNDDIYDFTVEGIDELTKYIESWEPASDKPAKEAEYDYEGNLVKGEQDYTINDGDGAAYMHLCFDENGDVYYVRPVIFD